MSDTWVVIVALTMVTFSIRIGGVLLGQKLPTTGPWARTLNALPGCLIASLVSMLLFSGGPNEWVAGGIALTVAYLSKNLPLTILAG